MKVGCTRVSPQGACRPYLGKRAGSFGPQAHPPLRFAAWAGAPLRTGPRLADNHGASDDGAHHERLTRSEA